MKKRSVRTCPECRKTKKINSFDGDYRICNECVEELKNKKIQPKIKLIRKEVNGIFFSTCRKCGEFIEVKNRFVTFFTCKDCKEKIKKQLKENSKKDLCEHCGKEFNTINKKNNSHICEECKTYKTKCFKCNNIYSRKDNFKIRKFICDECSKKIEEEEKFKQEYRFCRECNQYKKIGTEIKKKSFYCFECNKKRRVIILNNLKKKSWERICPDCGKKVITEVPRATVVYCKSCREHKIKIHKEKKLKRINRKTYDFCQICNNRIENSKNKQRTIVCDKCKNLKDKFKEEHREGEKYYKFCKKCGNKFEVLKDYFWNSLVCKDCRKKLINCSNTKHRFGYQGNCSDGHRFSSLNEQDYDEWLNEKGVKHIPQLRLKPTLRRCDFYLPDYNIYLEIDGLNKEDDIDWYGKLSDYEKLNLKLNKDYFIFKPVSKNFIVNKEICFSEIDKLLLPILKKELI